MPARVRHLIAAATMTVALALPADASPPAGPTALENLLVRLARADPPAAWRATPGVTWRSFTLPDPGREKASFEWEGDLRLRGLEDVPVPRGIGADNRAVQANEGEARLLVQGSAATGVRWVELMKHYPTRDYAALLRDQLSDGGRIALVAGRCKSDRYGEGSDPGNTVIYRIDLNGAASPVYALASREEKGTRYSPGETSLSFTGERPSDSYMALMDCTVHDVRERVS